MWLDTLGTVLHVEAARLEFETIARGWMRDELRGMLSPDAATTLYQPVVITAIAALVAAIISGLFNLYNNSLRRFSGQRWWELKAHRYTELFDALFDVELYTQREIEQLTGEGRFGEEYMKTLGNPASSGFLQIRRAAAIGSVIFNQSATAVISELQVSLDAPTYNLNSLEELEHQLSAVRKAKERLTPIARDDLQVE